MTQPNPDSNAYSVVISSTGRTEYLLELIQSLERQTIKPEEVLILLDDNRRSKEYKKILAESMGPLDVRIYLLQGMNLPSKRNSGAHIARTEIVMYSDDDDIWMPEKAEKVIASIAGGHKAVCHNFSCFGAEEKTSCNKNGKQSKILRKALMMQGDNIYGGGSSISCTRSLALAIPFDESLDSCEDLDWWRRIQLSGIRVYYLGEDLVSYRRHGTNMGKNRLLMASTLFRVGTSSLIIGLISTISGTAMIIKSAVRAIK